MKKLLILVSLLSLIPTFGSAQQINRDECILSGSYHGVLHMRDSSTAFPLQATVNKNGLFISMQIKTSPNLPDLDGRILNGYEDADEILHLTDNQALSMSGFCLKHNITLYNHSDFYHLTIQLTMDS